MKIRLNKFLSQAGIASRREADRLILEGRVSVNRETVEKLGLKIDPQQDSVEVDRKKVIFKEHLIYVLLNKPKGYIVSLKDPLNRPKVTDLLPPLKGRIFPVGRLDFNTEGVLILTNDGPLAHRLAHPRYQVEKVYIAEVKGIPDKEKIEKLRKGVYLYGKKTSPAKVRIITKKGKKAILEIKLCEGRKREVRLMCLAVGHPVIELKRVELGGIRLKGLKSGEWRYLKKSEIESLKRKVKLSS
ncbi:MAG: pseudouridine synthase [Candidatus Aminicenantia bacterium]